MSSLKFHNYNILDGSHAVTKNCSFTSAFYMLTSWEVVVSVSHTPSPYLQEDEFANL